jgi:hypothetical protein
VKIVKIIVLAVNQLLIVKLVILVTFCWIIIVKGVLLDVLAVKDWFVKLVILDIFLKMVNAIKLIVEQDNI